MKRIDGGMKYTDNDLGASEPEKPASGPGFSATIKGALLSGLMGAVLFSYAPGPVERINRVNIPDCGGNPIAAVATSEDNSIRCEVRRYDKIIYGDEEIGYDSISSLIDHLGDEPIDLQVVSYLRYTFNISDSEGQNKVTSHVDVFDSDKKGTQEAVDELAGYVTESLGAENGSQEGYLARSGYRNPKWLDEETCIGVERFIERNNYLSMQGDEIVVDMFLGAENVRLTAGEIREYLGHHSE